MGSKRPNNEILERLIAQHRANLSLISNSLFKDQGIKATTSEISKWINADEELKKLASEARQTRQDRQARQVRQARRQAKQERETLIRQELKILIVKYKGNMSAIARQLSQRCGEKVWPTTTLNLIKRDEELTRLLGSAETARKIRRVQNQAIKSTRRGKRLPKEELKQLIIEHKGYEPRIIRNLAERGVKVGQSTLSKWINQDSELRELIKAVRRVRKGKRVQKRVIKQVAVASQAETSSLRNEKIPLSEEEIEVLLAYQEGDSFQTLGKNSKKPGGRIDSLIASILIKKHATTLGEAKEKFQKELVAT